MLAEVIDDISETTLHTTAVPDDAGLQDRAACRHLEGSLTHVFFSEDLHDVIQAKTICAGCPVQLACLEGAVARHEPWGVWGGQLFLNGRILPTKRRVGRPPKNPRPEDQLPDIPVPAHLRRYLRSA